MIALVYDAGGEWVALYKDGSLMVEGHSLTERDVLRAVDIEYETYEMDMSNGEYLPSELNDLNLSEAT